VEERWNYVLQGMVEKGWLSEADRAKQKFPETQENWSFIPSNSQAGYIQAQVLKELEKAGVTGDMVNSQGLKITTSLDSRMMRAAAAAVKQSAPSPLPRNVRVGLISVNPANGEIPAFWAGDGKKQADTVFFEAPQVGSSFKPYVLATALRQGYNVKSMIDGHSPQAFDFQGNSVPVNTPQAYKVSNDEGDPPMGVIDLVRATQWSVNTAYVKLGLALNLKDVRETAAMFGVPKPALDAHEGKAGISLGIANYPAVYQAAGYAAFANGGTPVTPHLITKIERPDGTKIPLPWKKQPRILSAEQTAQANQAMQAVVRGGTGRRAALSDRPVAGKTGTTEKSAAAWFVGYVPQLSTAVTMFDRKNQPMTSIPGYGGGVYGGQIPASIWQAYMMRATQNMEARPFQPPAFTEGSRNMWDSPRPSPTPTPQAPDCRGQKRWTDPACQNQGPTPEPGEPCGGFLQPECPPEEPTPDPTPTDKCRPIDPNCEQNNEGDRDSTTTQSHSLTPARTEEE
jgi:membrane peptidoglycan carboxypeptidase